MLLAVDTSTKYIGIALYDGSQVLGELVWQSKNRHTVELAPAIQNIMEGSGIEPTDLKALAVALGPGSFTALRIGLAMVKGLALGLHIPVIGIPTLDIVAASQPIQTLPLIAILQAGRNKLAYNWYSISNESWSPQGEICLSTVNDLISLITQPTLVCGELTPSERVLFKETCPQAIVASPAQSARRPSYLAEMAWQHWQAGQIDDIVSLTPIYLHYIEGIKE